MKNLHFKIISHINIISKQANELMEGLKETYDGIFQQIEKFVAFISKIADLLGEFEHYPSVDWWNKEINHYRLSIKANTKEP